MMQFPVIFHIGQFDIAAHTIFEVLSFFIGFRYFLYLKKKKGDHIAETNRIWIFIGATGGAFLGSRLLGALENPAALIHSASPILYAFSTKTIVGGLIGGLAGVELVKKMIGEQKSSGDLFTLPLILGMIIGRIGCFLNGTAESVYGIETSSWAGMDLGDGLQRHPIALYEILFLILLWIVFSFFQKQALKEGMRFKLFMIIYMAFRFGIEYIKPHVPIIFGLSAIQVAAILVWVYYLPTLFDLLFRTNNIYRYAEHP